MHCTKNTHTKTVVFQQLDTRQKHKIAFFGKVKICFFNVILHLTCNASQKYVKILFSKIVFVSVSASNPSQAFMESMNGVWKHIGRNFLFKMQYAK